MPRGFLTALLNFLGVVITRKPQTETAPPSREGIDEAEREAEAEEDAKFGPGRT